jgi:hypothetical protein
MRKVLIVLAGALTCLLFSNILTSYDHLKTHKKINLAVSKSFTDRYSASINREDKFYNYTFIFSGSGALEGEEVSEPGLVDATESDASKNVTGWIEHGGYSADEPELFASFVHFYDPTQPPGERYLKDLLDKFYVSWALENPRIDQIEWAITSNLYNEHNYEDGKKFFEFALQEPNEDQRKSDMAAAWRSLGQTLHLIADMGIACHVRDDAHPAVGAGKLGYKWAFDADPYEEIVYQYVTANGIDNFLQGSVDPAVAAFSKNAKTAKSIAEQMAAYTNSNFFSHETISGNGVEPKIHPEKTYPSPKLEDCMYNEETAIFSRNIGGNLVKMSKDLSYLSLLSGFRGYPYIDKECVLSQATALFPQIREAGLNVIRCFIPDLEVMISSLTKDSVFGEVIHTTDPEYPKKIKYNGPVQIHSFKDKKLIGRVVCEDGVFKDKIDLTGFDRVKDQLYAEIECGYVYIKSDPYEDPLYKKVTIRFSSIGDGGIIENTASSWVVSGMTMGSASPKPLNWDQGSFYSVYKTISGTTAIEQSVYGNLSGNLTVIEDLKATSKVGTDTNYMLSYVDFSNVPVTVYPDSLVSIIPDGQAQQFIEELRMENVTPEQYSEIKKVHWNNMRVRIVFSNKLGSEPIKPDIQYSR